MRSKEKSESLKIKCSEEKKYEANEEYYDQKTEKHDGWGTWSKKKLSWQMLQRMLGKMDILREISLDFFHYYREVWNQIPIS